MVTASQITKPTHDRITGYKRALEEDGRIVDDGLIVTGDSRDRDGFTEQNGYEAMMKLLSLDHLPDACFCNSDIQAIGALKAMQDIGVVIPIVGFDDIEVSDFFSLSTMRQPMKEMGFMAIEKLMNRIENKDAEVSRTVFSPELILRNTTEEVYTPGKP